MAKQKKQTKEKTEFKVGRPPKFENADELGQAIQNYFEKGIKKRKVLVGREKNEITIPVPTITGLCFHIGYESRQSFYDLEKSDKFSYTVKRARLFIEKEYEEQLSTGNVTGAIFALKNFGWKDERIHDHKGGLPIKYSEEAKKRLEKYE